MMRASPDKTSYINNPQNRSPSKNSYTFAKNERFFKYNHSSNDLMYDINRELGGNKATTLGYGNRESYLDKQRIRTPSPDKYRIKSQFEKKDKGYSFARPSSPSKRGINDRIDNLIEQLHRVKNNETPGPGTYNWEKDARNSVYSNSKYKNSPGKRFGSEARGYSPIKSIAPGPGSYSVFSEFGNN